MANKNIAMKSLGSNEMTPKNQQAYHLTVIYCNRTIRKSNGG